ncbi:hypothetical protein HK097_008937 [Rhizophlyctis rosea]|uniref:Translin n=1 Tax=Rhizophlyctis rosea TaxID=64517 RepID=A0AAD5X0S7_9FUNG|nr:hypothetical protein HK097_008937 [Rhizophlyctis rosea]
MTDLNFFQDIQATLEHETDVRENIRTAVRELDRTCRTVAAILNKVHTVTTPTVIAEVSTTARGRFPDIHNDLKKLAALIPAEQYYRYNGMWTFVLQQACYLAAYTTYLHYERLVTVPEVEEMLGVPVSLRGDLPTFHIGIEDLLHGIVSLTGELTRLTVNCVTHGDFQRPFRIHQFIVDLHSGFQLLNLKNDTLRKRFDSIKYDIKKTEEVVYDISVRKLATKPEAGGGQPTA